MTDTFREEDIAWLEAEAKDQEAWDEYLKQKMGDRMMGINPEYAQRNEENNELVGGEEWQGQLE